MTTITISKKLHHCSAIFIVAIFFLGVAKSIDAQETSAGEITEIPRPKPDTSRNPPTAERRRVALGVPMAERTAEGKQAIIQNLDAAERILPMTENDALTIQGCPGITMSKEEALRSGSVCASARP